MPNKAWVVHISDLHLAGSLEGGTSINEVPGWGAHDKRALIALGNFLRTFEREHVHEPRALFISGDATACGDLSELSFYKTLLTRGVAVDAFTSIPTFAKGFSKSLDMAGNHDFWGGQKLMHLGKRNSDVRAHHFPKAQPARLVLGQYTICTHVLCSTSGATDREQVMAVGGFTPEDIAAVAASIDSANSNKTTLKIAHYIMTHHSPSHGSRWIHGLNPKSRQDLEKLCRDKNVRGLLTGHTHKYFLDTKRKDKSLPPETRSSSTLQKRSRREFLVHEFEERVRDREGPSLRWQSHVWKYNEMDRYNRVRKDVEISWAR